MEPSDNSSELTSTQDPTEALARLMGAGDDDIPKERAPLGSDDDGEDDQDEIAADEPVKFKVRVDGQDLEVTQAELLAGYSRQGDYSKKTAELSQQRQQVEQAAQQIQAERQHYQNQLAQAAQALGGRLQEAQQTDWQALLNNDPQEYLKQRHVLEQTQAAFQNARQAQQHAAHQAQQEQNHASHQRLQSEHQALLDKLPDWKDADKAKAGHAQVRDYLTANGFQASEVDGIADHRAVLLAHKAMLFDALQAKAVGSAQKVANLPPPRVLRPGGSDGTSAADGRTRAMKALGRSGSTDAAADVLMAMMGGKR